MIRYFKAIIPCLLVHGFVLFSLPAIGALDCDFDLDSDADGSDLAQFALWYAEGNPAADVTDDGSGNYSDVVTMTVRKGMNKDINGDSAVDLAVGASFWVYWSGRVYVFHNSGAGIPDVDLSAGDTADTTLSGAANSFFGAMLGD